MPKKKIYNQIRLADSYFEFDHSPLPPTYSIHVKEKIINSENHGILTYFKGFKYPVKGFTELELAKEVDDVKKFFKSWFSFLASSPVRYFVVLALLTPWVNRKIIKCWLNCVGSYCNYHLKRHFLKPEFYSRPIREIHRIGMKIWGEDRLVQF